MVISGGSRGIGRECLEKFATGGWDVAFCARNAGAVEELLTELKTRYPQQQFFGMAADLSDAAQAKHFGMEVLKNFGIPDVLINNAGVFLPGPVHNEEEGQLEKLMNTNLFSAYHLSRVLIAEMKKRRSGYIFNISSVAGLQAYPAGGSYSITKFALTGFSKALRMELKEFGIRVTTVYPGATYTDSWSSSGLPEERFMDAGDLAEVIFSCAGLKSRTVPEELLIRPLLGDI